MEKTWRWFGKNDTISLSDLKQIGVEGIVTALHHIPNGEVWSLQEISELKSYIEKAGLHWSVVESLPVSEGIKFGSQDRDILIENYKTSLENLGKAGINIVCYNFMPVIDWIRTDLLRKQDDGTYTLYFDLVRFAYFDCYILKRKGAANDYSDEIMLQVRELDKTITSDEKANLIDTIIVKTQGFINGNINENEQQPVILFNKLLKNYENIDKGGLRDNLRYFLERVIPVAEKYGIQLCIHPDDPPFPVLGLPRIVTNDEDIDWLLTVVNSPCNGLTFCAGSLSAGLHNDVPRLASKYAARTGFVHLRSTDVMPNGDFVEASHLGGRANLVEVIKIFENEQNNRKLVGREDSVIPMRVDHGPLMLTDIDKKYNPGYSFLGRMKALSEVSGMMAVVHQLENR